jgi:hypothetical protein
MVVPEDIGRRLWAVLNRAREVNGTALVHVQVRSSQNLSSRDCKQRRNNVKQELISALHPRTECSKKEGMPKENRKNTADPC